MYGSKLLPISTPGQPPPSQTALSRRLAGAEPSGSYIYVVDEYDAIHVAPFTFFHPTVLGGTAAARYAGELDIGPAGHVSRLTNQSGHFRFPSPNELCCVAAGLRQLGFTVGQVIWHHQAGQVRPIPVRCP